MSEYIIDRDDQSSLKINTDGSINIVPNGSIADANNSTETPLLADAVFTGVATEILHFASICILMQADQPSATDGLEVQFSANGTTWHTGEEYTYILADSTKFFTPPAQAAYFRIVYTNGDTDQTYFHLHTILKKTAIKYSSHNISDPIKDEDDAELVKAVITGNEVVSGEYKNVGTYDNGLVNSMIVTPIDANAIPFSNTAYGTKVVQYDSNGNAITSSIDADGDYHLDTALIQKIITSTKNSTTTNLAAGATFTGAAEETFGINSIQVFHASDQDCTIYIDQSTDDEFPSTSTITDSFECLANSPCSRVFISVSPYYRMRVTNNGDSTTTTLATFTGLAPILNPLPRSLTDDDRLKVETTLTGRHNTDRHAWINPTNEQAISPVYRMVGTNFDGETKDPNFWTELVDAGTDGSVTQGGGEIELKTSTTSTGWAKYTSKRKSRFVAGSAQYFSGGFNFKTAATADNIRRVGAYTTTDTVNTPVDGFYFELDNATFSVNSRADAGTVSSVASGSFNGDYGPTWSPTADTYYRLTIEWSPLGAFFYVNGKLLHKKVGAHQSYFMTLPITIENIYTSGSVDVNFETVGMYIARQGELQTNPTSKYLTTGTHVLKYGAGVLTKIIVGDNVSGSVTVYDNTAASGTLLTVLDTSVGSSPLGGMDYNVPFSDGLTIVIVGTNKITIVYE